MNTVLSLVLILFLTTYFCDGMIIGINEVCTSKSRLKCDFFIYFFLFCLKIMCIYSQEIQHTGDTSKLNRMYVTTDYKT